jgi:hypothetical protein
MFGVEVNKEFLLLLAPALLADASLEVVVVAFAALLAVAPLDAVPSLHDLRN